MFSIDKVRYELQNEIEIFINVISDERQRNQMRFVFFGDCKTPTWGSLARGSLLLLLSGGGSGRNLLAKAIEIIHHASLIVDDQIDRAHTRREKPAFWIKYGPEECILFSHMMVAMAITDLVMFDRNHNGANLAQSYALKAMRHMFDAELEARQILFENMETYLSRARRKTGSLYGLVVQLAGLIPTTVISNRNLCISSLQLVGVAHQMLDDFIDSDPTKQRNTVFSSHDAEEENCSRGIYQFLEYGFTLDQLRELHKQYSYEAIRSLKQCLSNCPERQVIIRLCEKTCLGSSSVAKVRGID